jgi:hypothetical protein
VCIDADYCHRPPVLSDPSAGFDVLPGHQRKQGEGLCCLLIQLGVGQRGDDRGRVVDQADTSASRAALSSQAIAGFPSRSQSQALAAIRDQLGGGRAPRDGPAASRRSAGSSCPAWPPSSSITESTAHRALFSAPRWRRPRPGPPRGCAADGPRPAAGYGTWGGKQPTVIGASVRALWAGYAEPDDPRRVLFVVDPLNHIVDQPAQLVRFELVGRRVERLMADGVVHVR